MKVMLLENLKMPHRFVYVRNQRNAILAGGGVNAIAGKRLQSCCKASELVQKVFGLKRYNCNATLTTAVE